MLRGADYGGFGGWGFCCICILDSFSPGRPRLELIDRDGDEDGDGEMAAYPTGEDWLVA